MGWLDQDKSHANSLALDPAHIRRKKAPQAGRPFLVFCLPSLRHYSGF
jgi:hypothetical protein